MTMVNVSFQLVAVPCPVSLNYWLSQFVVEARREDGQLYPPTSILVCTERVSGILVQGKRLNK